MMALPGMTRDEFERIRPYVAALPRGTKINVCTAKAAFLAMLGEGMLDFSNEELLTANRRDGCFPTPDMFSHIPQQDRDRLLSTSTSWFRALTAVRIGTSEFTLYSLINRGGNASAIRTVLRSTGTE
jgi:general secretion pathway protein K